MGFNLADYETVESRLEKFIKDFPDFRIDTVMESFANDRFIVKASIFRTYADVSPFSTGYAEEKVSDRGVNSTSALENCETSAIGRALANAGYAAKGKRASQSEMAKVNRVKNDLASEQIANAPLAVNNSWDEFVTDKPVQDVVPLAQAAALVQQSFGDAEPVLTCSHGERNIREGIKNNKAWRGAMCPKKLGPGERSDCSPIWYVMSATTGKWRLPEGVE